jgi:hypothetical protein
MLVPIRTRSKELPNYPTGYIATIGIAHMLA